DTGNQINIRRLCLRPLHSLCDLGGKRFCSRIEFDEKPRARCPRFASVLWTLTWAYYPSLVLPSIFFFGASGLCEKLFNRRVRREHEQQIPDLCAAFTKET